MAEKKNIVENKDGKPSEQGERFGQNTAAFQGLQGAPEKDKTTGQKAGGTPPKESSATQATEHVGGQVQSQPQPQPQFYQQPYNQQPENDKASERKEYVDVKFFRWLWRNVIRGLGKLLGFIGSLSMQLIRKGYERFLAERVRRAWYRVTEAFFKRKGQKGIVLRAIDNKTGDVIRQTVYNRNHLDQNLQPFDWKRVTEEFMKDGIAKDVTLKLYQFEDLRKVPDRHAAAWEKLASLETRDIREMIWKKAHPDMDKVRDMDYMNFKLHQDLHFKLSEYERLIKDGYNYGIVSKMKSDVDLFTSEGIQDFKAIIELLDTKGTGWVDSLDERTVSELKEMIRESNLSRDFGELLSLKVTSLSAVERFYLRLSHNENDKADEMIRWHDLNRRWVKVKNEFWKMSDYEKAEIAREAREVGYHDLLHAMAHKICVGVDDISHVHPSLLSQFVDEKYPVCRYLAAQYELMLPHASNEAYQKAEIEFWNAYKDPEILAIEVDRLRGLLKLKNNGELYDEKKHLKEPYARLIASVLCNLDRVGKKPMGLGVLKELEINLQDAFLQEALFAERERRGVYMDRQNDSGPNMELIEEQMERLKEREKAESNQKGDKKSPMEDIWIKYQDSMPEFDYSTLFRTEASKEYYKNEIKDGEDLERFAGLVWAEAMALVHQEKPASLILKSGASGYLIKVSDVKDSLPQLLEALDPILSLVAEAEGYASKEEMLEQLLGKVKEEDETIVFTHKPADDQQQSEPGERIETMETEVVPSGIFNDVRDMHISKERRGELGQIQFIMAMHDYHFAEGPQIVEQIVGKEQLSLLSSEEQQLLEKQLGDVFLVMDGVDSGRYPKDMVSDLLLTGGLYSYILPKVLPEGKNSLEDYYDLPEQKRISLLYDFIRDFKDSRKEEKVVSATRAGVHR